MSAAPYHRDCVCTPHTKGNGTLGLRVKMSRGCFLLETGGLFSSAWTNLAIDFLFNKADWANLGGTWEKDNVMVRGVYGKGEKKKPLKAESE